MAVAALSSPISSYHLPTAVASVLLLLQSSVFLKDHHMRFINHHFSLITHQPSHTDFTTSKRMKIDGDIISGLPDPILHHILSFLDMKYVMQTCILSKRWRYLWSSLSFLNFNENEYLQFLLDVGAIIKKSKKEYEVAATSNVTNFKNFVNKVLSFKDEITNIHRLRLSCGGDYIEKGDFATWIQVAASHSIEVLDVQIYFKYRRTLELPHCLFNCASLTTLKLSSKGLLPLFNLKISEGLPALKTLHLNSFELIDGEAADNFFSRCPVLETLVISKCKLTETKSLAISSLQLKNLEIGESSMDSYSDFTCKITISAPNLSSFTCRDYMFIEYSLVNTYSLVNADLDTDLELYYYAISDSGLLEFEVKEHAAMR